MPKVYCSIPIKSIIKKSPLGEVAEASPQRAGGKV